MIVTPPILLQADARALPLADASVHCAVTSPPYWGLRDYGVAGQIGLEPTLQEYLATMVQVFREVRRVLRDDGTCWVNMGDGYNAGTSASRKAGGEGVGRWQMEVGGDGRRTNAIGLKPKDLLMQPHRLAIALQEDGWYVRSDIVWHKPNPMPESVTDRPTKSHEYIFLLSKSERYFYDTEAVKEASQSGASDVRKMLEKLPRIGGKHKDLIDPLSKANANSRIGQKRAVGDPAGRNCRSVWTITTKPCKEAHFATFPIDLPLRCIKAGTSEKGVCPVCGAPWKRVVEKIPVGDWNAHRRETGDMLTHRHAGLKGDDYYAHAQQPKTTQWLPTCKCPAHDPIPATVLDPFGGAATTALACLELNRRAVIVERKWEYIGIGRGRIEQWTPRKAKKTRMVKTTFEPSLFAVGGVA